MDKRIETISEHVKQAGGKAYLVGGYVRDLIMGRTPGDMDIVVTGLTPERLQDTFPTAKFVGKDFPVLLVQGIEVALARVERSVGVGHDAFTCETAGVTLEQDLKRRDLTINAIAMDLETGKLIDPFNGREAIREQVLDPVSEAFAEDPLRPVRAARFAAQLGFVPSDRLIAASQKLRGEVKSLPAERVFKEMDKALVTERPSRFFIVLGVFCLQDVLFPELYALQGRPQPEQYHSEGDAYEHTLLVVDRTRELGGDAACVFAALAHDFGKAVTDDGNLPHHYEHEHLGVPIAVNFADRIRAPREYKKLAVLVTAKHLRGHKFLQMRAVKQVDLIVSLKNEVRRFALVCKADIQGRGPASLEETYVESDAMLVAEQIVRDVRGDQFATIKNGRVIAQKMRELRARKLKELLPFPRR